MAGLNLVDSACATARRDSTARSEEWRQISCLFEARDLSAASTLMAFLDKLHYFGVRERPL